MNIGTNIRIVSLNDKGLPSTRERPVVGDMYLTPSRTEPEMYDQWIWAGDTLEWQKLGSIPSFDEEKSMREQRVKNVKAYFKEKKERYMMTMMGRLTDALNEVGNAFKELKEDS